MEIKKEREALIAEIEVFKAEMLKSYVIKAWADSYVNTDPFSYAIFEDENNKIWWMKAQTHEFWRIWQAAKAQAVQKDSVVVSKWTLALALNSIENDEDNEGIIEDLQELIHKAQEQAND